MISSQVSFSTVPRMWNRACQRRCGEAGSPSATGMARVRPSDQRELNQDGWGRREWIDWTRQSQQHSLLSRRTIRKRNTSPWTVHDWFHYFLSPGLFALVSGCGNVKDFSIAIGHDGLKCGCDFSFLIPPCSTKVRTASRLTSLALCALDRLENASTSGRFGRGVEEEGRVDFVATCELRRLNNRCAGRSGTTDTCWTLSARTMY